MSLVAPQVSNAIIPQLMMAKLSLIALRSNKPHAQFFLAFLSLKLAGYSTYHNQLVHIVSSSLKMQSLMKLSTQPSFLIKNHSLAAYPFARFRPPAMYSILNTMITNPMICPPWNTPAPSRIYTDPMNPVKRGRPSTSLLHHQMTMILIPLTTNHPLKLTVNHLTKLTHHWSSPKHKPQRRSPNHDAAPAETIKEHDVL